MSQWVILVGRPSDLDNAATPHKIMTSRDYLARPGLFRGQRPKIINLARSYAYQSRAYYASLLAGARGHRIIPTVETMIDLSEKKLYENALPELDAALARAVHRSPTPLDPHIRIYFGHSPDPRLDRFAKLAFDWFRAPALEITLEPVSPPKIKKIGFAGLGKLDADEMACFVAAMERYTAREWRAAKAKTPTKYSFATLYDPKEELPPTSVESLKHWARVASRMSVEVEPITKKDLARLANFDALFIRETTSISNHTYRFARRAMQEGMPVIDDPISMIRCTNKVYLNELMEANGVATPPSVMISGKEDCVRAADLLGFPMVLKIPDGSFSRGVKKVSDMAGLEKLAGAWLEDTDLLLAQKYMPTQFDWRIGVLGGQPLFAVQYHMAKEHWQIINHDTGGRPMEGGFKAFTLADAPPHVLDVGLKAARCIGDGLYGVDIKETEDGVFLIEVNDNPNLEHGVEDFAEKDEVWTRLTRWFIDRVEG
ncbi:RimK family protein [Consotaella salsifontis]|uniref:Glutathione synthase/RimK-type ligase, ATP-grasp superfamily n=1 Tax=Consotaella salsifontis TaxID=1365950 RepID=A0A1T4QW16_9HYPH|nr:RimK family protein [Consotaella salsifontis]SKA07952.1 Glutathione synthase/RimK-type ligase, ATP-grasp superfamily [Consotaella salsifontis]